MTVTPTTVEDRLDYWNTRKPPHGYSQTTYSRGPDGYNYRNDCSGYVSMLLSYTKSPYTGALVGSTYTRPTTRGDLRFGDLLIALAGDGWESGHVVMFDHWVSDNVYYGHEFGWGAVPAHRNIAYPYTDPDGERDSRTFKCYRPVGLSTPVKETSPKTAYGAYEYIAPGKRDLHEYTAGADVKDLQSVLNKWYPHLKALTVDGYDGPETTGRVDYYKKRAHLPVDGTVGKETWKGLGFNVDY